MNLEQVKEHFKYAKEVRCLDDGLIYKIDLSKIKKQGNIIFCNITAMSTLFKSDTNQLAEILTYIFERGEEVEVKDLGDEKWNKYNFLTFNSENDAIVEYANGTVGVWDIIRKLTPESKLEPQLSELKKVAEANGMSLEIIFKQK